jgi:hypothetical protein
MFTRPSPFSPARTVASIHIRPNLSRDKASRSTACGFADLPPATSEELLTALLAAGGHVLARQAHGVLVDIRKRLVFLPPSGWVSDSTLDDALRAANMTVERFLELRGVGG